MNRFLIAGLLMVACLGVSRAEESRFLVAQGTIPSGGAGSAPTPVVIKVDAVTGDTWRLLIANGGYWWVPIKNGVLPEKKAPAAEEIPPAAASPAAPAAPKQ